MPSISPASSTPSAKLIESILHREANYYDILGVPTECTFEEIRRQYLRRSRAVHPGSSLLPLPHLADPLSLLCVCVCVCVCVCHSAILLLYHPGTLSICQSPYRPGDLVLFSFLSPCHSITLSTWRSPLKLIYITLSPYHPATLAICQSITLLTWRSPLVLIPVNLSPCLLPWRSPVTPISVTLPPWHPVNLTPRHHPLILISYRQERSPSIKRCIP